MTLYVQFHTFCQEDDCITHQVVAEHNEVFVDKVRGDRYIWEPVWLGSHKVSQYKLKTTG
jgi:hypothetical protein